MTILIYCEPLKVPSTGTPMRNVLKKLISERTGDHFLLVIRKGSEQDVVLRSFFEELKNCTNWELIVYPVSRVMSNILGLLKYGNYCRIDIKADIYFNPDCNSLGRLSHPLIITVADLSAFEPLRFTSYTKKWQLWLRRFMLTNGIKNSDHVMTISEFSKSEITARFPFAANKITVGYNGIDDLWFSHPAKQPQSGAYKYWIWWGAISPRKNLPNLLKAYADLLASQKVPLLRVIYGNAEVPSSLIELVRELNLTKYVIFERGKRIEELIDIVGMSDGLVFPSFIEGFGMPVIESFARGIPVLTSSSSSLKEIAGGLAILVDPENVASIKLGLNQLTLKTNTVENQFKRKNWAMNFSLYKVADTYSQIIDGINVKKAQL